MRLQLRPLAGMRVKDARREAKQFLLRATFPCERRVGRVGETHKGVFHARPDLTNENLVAQGFHLRPVRPENVRAIRNALRVFMPHKIHLLCRLVSAVAVGRMEVREKARAILPEEQERAAIARFGAGVQRHSSVFATGYLLGKHLLRVNGRRQCLSKRGYAAAVPNTHARFGKSVAPAHEPNGDKAQKTYAPRSCALPFGKA